MTTIAIDKKPHRAYSGSGAEGLINGISGSDNRFGDKEWLGFWGDDIEINIDLGEETKINSVETRFYNGNGQWIYAPAKLTFSIDNRLVETVDINKQDRLIVNWKVNLNDYGRIIKLT